MSVPHRITDRLPLFRRLVAAAGVVLVLLLAFSSVSPVLHDHLHAADTHGASDTCAVVLFASGVTLAGAAAALATPQAAWSTFVRPLASELFLASPRYLRQPERGPPAV